MLYFARMPTATINPAASHERSVSRSRARCAATSAQIHAQASGASIVINPAPTAKTGMVNVSATAANATHACRRVRQASR